MEMKALLTVEIISKERNNLVFMVIRKGTLLLTTTRKQHIEPMGYLNTKPIQDVPVIQLVFNCSLFNCLLTPFPRIHGMWILVHLNI
jgi:hypothetical protein